MKKTDSTADLELLEVLPDPVSLIESMRAVGYSAESAIADIVDNSISARAKKISIKYEASGSPYVAILDDGTGMSPDELTNAMRHGSKNPSENRNLDDLGRFGLGMKTASLSQCRKMTVVSKKDGFVSSRSWDLDVVQDKNRWVVVVPTENQIQKLPLVEKLNEAASGTLVVWQDLDKLIAKAKDVHAELTIKLSPLTNHLAMVFHRFTSNEDGKSSVEIFVNGNKLPTRDPFLCTAKLSQQQESQIIKNKQGNVNIVPYVLPPIARLNQSEIEIAGGEEGLKNSQGFYVYRGRRLVIWGTWFRIVPNKEFYKLARVKVDIPNSFDELWNLDIKKSVAYPPDFIRDKLKELTPRFASEGKKVITFPGRTRGRNVAYPIWQRRELSSSERRYEINVEHPVVLRLADKMPEDLLRSFNVLLDLIQIAIPLESIYADMCEDRREGGSHVEYANLLQVARELMDMTQISVEEVLKMDPFFMYPKYIPQLQKDLLV